MSALTELIHNGGVDIKWNAHLGSSMPPDGMECDVIYIDAAPT